MTIESKSWTVSPYNEFHAFLLKVRALCEAADTLINECDEKPGFVVVSYSDYAELCKATRALQDDLT